jgi:DNA helicase-2/ATP-dependent DNA helicase PcrA
VLFLTFSRTAVSQIAKRAPAVFAGGGSRIEISTFHGFAWRVLRLFGRYAGHGLAIPELQSASRAKLFGRQRDRLTYDDLLPEALECFRSETVRRLFGERWPLVICDEFQDTDAQQWELLRVLHERARLLLLGDANQMIYTFRRRDGVSERRLADARAAADRVVELEPVSHRDPTGAIPAMAESVRQRRFDDEAVVVAFADERFRVLANIHDEVVLDTLRGEIQELRRTGHRSIGVFAHSNESVALLAAEMAEANISHVLVGIPEAHAEALNAMATLCEFGIGAANERAARVALATYLTSCMRGTNAPAVAVALARGGSLAPGLEERVTAALNSIRAAAEGTVGQLLEPVLTTWEELGITSGRRPWKRALQDLASLTRTIASKAADAQTIVYLRQMVDRRRPHAMFEVEQGAGSEIQLMNFHQTKGREADAVILVYRDNDYLADRGDAEPFEDPSRVLFVSLTRARRSVVIVLPNNPHPLIAPFQAYA